MPWLVVLGRASWRPDPEHVFEAGLHEVDQETAERARASGIESLVVTSERPVLAQSEPGPLTLDDIRLGIDGVTVSRPESTVIDLEPRVEGTVVPLDFPCAWCPEKFPSRGAYDRHVEFHHAVRAAPAEPPAEPSVESLPEGAPLPPPTGIDAL